MEVAITYWSGSGHTRRLAEHVAAGVTDANPVLVNVATMDDAEWQVLDRAAAIVFGAPTYMGSVASGFKAFMDESSDRWAERQWVDKIAAGFTVATYPSGDKLATLTQLVVFAAQHGMIWVGQTEIGAPVVPERPGIDADGSSLGLMARSSRDKSVLIDAGDANTAQLFGRRIASAVRRWGGTAA